jgi:hypothetical protein
MTEAEPYGTEREYDHRDTGELDPLDSLLVRKGKQNERGCSKCSVSEMMAVMCGTCAYADGNHRCQHRCLCDDGPLESRRCCT